MYNLRINYNYNYDNKIKGNLAFKTVETNWLNTTHPIIIPISIHTIFHEGLNGRMKMEALINILKKNTKGRVTLLFTENAHLNVLGLKYPNALHICKEAANQLQKKYHILFNNCEIAHWQNCIIESPIYPQIKTEVQQLAKTDPEFQRLLHQDAAHSYTPLRRHDYPNKKLYIQKAVEDLIEQCICHHILADRGYRFQFYPGRQCPSIEYANAKSLLTFINVFLSIEKKRIVRVEKHSPKKL